MSYRKLTRGELWLCNTVFRNALAVHNVDVVRRRGISGGFTPYGRINLDPETYEEDFIGDDLMHPAVTLSKVHHFLHELCHSWQHFVGIGMTRAFLSALREARQDRKAAGQMSRNYTHQGWSNIRFMSIYSYDITKGGDLLDYSMEQQGEIISDYFALKLWSYRNLSSKPAGMPYPTLGQLQVVLTQFLSNPNYPRSKSTLNNMRAKFRDIPR